MPIKTSHLCSARGDPLNNALICKGKTYDDADGIENKLLSMGGFIGDSLPAATLSVDTLTAVVKDDEIGTRMLAAEGMLIVEGEQALATPAHVPLDERLKYGEAAEYYRKDSLFGKFYVNSVKRTGKRRYKIDCVSAVGLLMASYHYGGIYSGETAEAVIADIIGGVIPYTLDPALASVQIYGLLRKATRRDNLRDLLFAIGGQIRKDVAGNVNIVPMTIGTPYEISADEFYMGGSVTGNTPATTVNVTEHSFMQLPNDQVVTLFDGEAAAEEIITPNGSTVTGVLIDFAEPAYDLSIEGATILESGVNYAVISGSPLAVLTGTLYTHTQRVITRKVSSGTTPNVVSSSSCTLVNLLNGELVVDRLSAYYGSGKTVEADLVVTDQKPGDAVIITDPFGEEVTGYITDMELTMSAILKAKTTIVSGYIPPASGNFYSNLALITSDGTFTVPEDTKGKIYVVLIGGGDGGEAGEAGESGTSGSGYASILGLAQGKYSGDPGNGGNGGNGGKSGKVFISTIPVSAGDTFDVTIGTGGAGAVYGGTPGSGTATTFGDLSSADGGTANGYASVNGDIYALPGDSGFPGGRGQETSVNTGGGGERPTVEYDGQIWTAGTNGMYAIAQITNPSLTTAIAVGGCGGGAAYGANGLNGSDGIAVTESNGTGSAIGGAGAKGATPTTAADATIPGSGGQGGHGGGGGGGGGSACATGTLGGAGGAGGNGGTGGNGAPGIVLVYY